MMREAGVLYRDIPEMGLTEFSYTAYHVPTATKHQRVIYVLGGDKEKLALLAHWNRWDNWIYYPV